MPDDEHPNGMRWIAEWEQQWPPFATDPSLAIDFDTGAAVLAELGERLRDNYPFFHPVYAGQMLKPPHPIAQAAYAMAQRINPNNHALDGGPATAALERESIAQLAGMFGFDPVTSLGHLNSSGTIANLEALWIARSLHPDRVVAYSAEAHYTHARMCEVLGVRGIAIDTDREGRMHLPDLLLKLATGEIGTVVATAGTTSLGMIDPIAEIVEAARTANVRIHVDAAYGGFFALLANDVAADGTAGTLNRRDRNAFRAISDCDSIVIDPHKHALQPYGCGSVLFRDPSVGRFYKHDSPYTYFTSDELHLGEISLECSRAGAAAAALWTTLRCFPLAAETGLGSVLRATRAAAQRWAALIRESASLRLVVEPALDIVAFYPIAPSATAISAATERVFRHGMETGDYYLAKLILTPDKLVGHDIDWDAPAVTVLRSVLMKPEHLAFVPTLHKLVEQTVATI